MNKTLKDLGLITSFNFLITFLVWLPHYLRLPNFLGLNFSNGFNTIYRNFDGLEYVLIAKTFYNPISFAHLPQSLPAIYYAAHFPGYALLLLPLAPILGFLKSMLFVSLIFTILSTIVFYFLVRDFKLTTQPLYLSLLFSILPARWLIVHNTGSAEPVFIFFVILTFYLFMKYELSQKYWLIILAGISGALAQFTRPPGILLFIALSIYITWKIILEKQFSFSKLISRLISYAPLLLIPLTLLGVFCWYLISYQDFFAYFHSGDNIHLVFPPFQIFNQGQFWVGSIWLEDVVYIFILGFLGGLMLFKQRFFPLAFFVLTYLTASTLVAHRDISRYLLPVFPFCLIAFEKVLISKEFKIILTILALAFYLYAQNFLIANTAPIPNPQILD
ncbi:MAG: hypothetical protein V1808_02810 [Candidatus Daviesbacteria bacterium]